MSDPVPSAVCVNLFNLLKSPMEQVTVRPRRCQGTSFKVTVIGWWTLHVDPGGWLCLLHCWPDLRVSLQTSFPCLLTVMGQREPGEKLPTPPASEVPMLTQFQPLPQLIGARILILREILMGPGWEGCHPPVQLAWTVRSGC